MKSNPQQCLIFKARKPFLKAISQSLISHGSELHPVPKSKPMTARGEWSHCDQHRPINGLEHGKETNLPQSSKWLEKEARYLNFIKEEMRENY